MFKNIDGFELFINSMLVGLVVSILFVAVVLLPLQVRAERSCADNGYLVSSFYLDGAVFCQKKNAFGADEIVKVK